MRTMAGLEGRTEECEFWMRCIVEREKGVTSGDSG